MKIPTLAAIVLLATSIGARAEYVPLSMIQSPDAQILVGLAPVPQSNNVQTLVGPALIPPKPVAVLGQGYDITRNELRGDCVAQNGHDHMDGHKGSAITDIEYINTVSDMQSYDKVAQQSASLSVTYKLFTGSASDDVHTEKSFNSVDQFARIYRRIVTQVVTRNDGEWDSSVQSIVDKDLRKLDVFKAFTEVCGTHYVSAVYRGDVIDQTIHFKLNTEKYTSEGKKSFSAGLTGIFSAGYSDSSSETKLKEVSTYVATKGDAGKIGTSAPDPNKVGGILEAARFAHTTYSDQVAAVDPGDGAIIGIDVQPYWRLNIHGRDAFARWQDEAFDGLTARLDAYERLLSIIGDLQFASSITDATKLGVFYDETPSSLTTKLALAQNVQNTFQDAVKKCYDAALANNEKAAIASCGDDLRAALKTEEVEKARPKLRS